MFLVIFTSTLMYLPETMILLEYFSAARPLNKLKGYGIKSSDNEIMRYVENLEYGKLQKLNLK